MRLTFASIVLAATALLAAAPSHGQSQMELNQQASAGFLAADKRLNTVYAGLMAKISAAGKTRLRDAQVTWIRFRDQECLFETMATEDGSIHPMLVAACKARLTLQRVKDLEDQLNCEEGNLSCATQ